jgi:hypothetical protein
LAPRMIRTLAAVLSQIALGALLILIFALSLPA